jgi:hypothetical protein
MSSNICIALTKAHNRCTRKINKNNLCTQHYNMWVLNHNSIKLYNGMDPAKLGTSTNNPENKTPEFKISEIKNTEIESKKLTDSEYSQLLINRFILNSTDFLQTLRNISKPNEGLITVAKFKQYYNGYKDLISSLDSDFQKTRFLRFKYRKLRYWLINVYDFLNQPGLKKEFDLIFKNPEYCTDFDSIDLNKDLFNIIKDNFNYTDYYSVQCTLYKYFDYNTISNLVSNVHKLISNIKLLNYGSNGYVFDGTVMNRSNTFAIKVNKSKNDPNYVNDDIHELFVGLYGTNNLRKYIPNFVYIFGSFTCSIPVLPTEKITVGIPPNPDFLKPYLNKYNTTDFCVSDSDSVSYILYEFIEGQTLSSGLKTLSLNEFRNIILQICFSLHLAYSKCKYTNYDLHTSNVLLRELKDSKFYIKYPYKNSIYYLESNRVATIIDYGYSVIEYDSQMYGYELSNERIGIRKTGFPMYDIYKILLYSYLYSSTYKNIDIKSECFKLLQFFTTEDLNYTVDYEINSAYNTYGNLPPLEYLTKIQHSDFINYILDMKEYWDLCNISNVDSGLNIINEASYNNILQNKSTTDLNLNIQSVESQADGQPDSELESQNLTPLEPVLSLNDFIDLDSLGYLIQYYYKDATKNSISKPECITDSEFCGNLVYNLYPVCESTCVNTFKNILKSLNDSYKFMYARSGILNIIKPYNISNFKITLSVQYIDSKLNSNIEIFESLNSKVSDKFNKYLYNLFNNLPNPGAVIHLYISFETLQSFSDSQTVLGFNSDSQSERYYSLIDYNHYTKYLNNTNNRFNFSYTFGYNLNLEYNSVLSDDKFTNICNEFINTEISYCKGLIFCIQNWILDIYYNYKKYNLSKSKASEFFNNLDEITNYSYNFCKSLIVNPNNIIIVIAEFFNIVMKNIYLKYAADYKILISNLKLQNSKLQAKLQTRYNNYSIDSYLITPIQRLPRYILLLNEMQKVHKNDKILENCISYISNLTREFNIVFESRKK